MEDSGQCGDKVLFIFSQDPSACCVVIDSWSRMGVRVYAFSYIAVM